MKTRLLTLLCGVTGSLIAGGPASAAYIELAAVTLYSDGLEGP